ncbi:MAG TPA: cyclic nucleotide-binding domain-containing protein [Verrucomicrobia bacterium]|nr:cyclic nucleotide-binding domain-containing protein [Verrucomicrobiota bacterium]HOB32841.1 cyclic nucleotide-binding domain-containing protein [Verrucomicrobiota bacterium]HOP97664.1 cyclic nucleotide-binding domain-containing protein [Verrucomicrobiota bacterium]
MQPQSDNPNDFFIWGIDHAPYGPVELPVLVSWIKEERVLADTWVFARRAGTWQRAAEITELKMFFGKKNHAADQPASRPITPRALRRIKILAELTDAQLEHLADFLELQRVPQWSVVVRQGEPGEAMYLVLEGELRARIPIGDQEMILSTFGPGEFFGEMALFDQGPRSADVVANVDSVLLRLSNTAFNRLTREAPALATPFLQSTARTLSARIRADNKRIGRMKEQFSAGTGN